MSTSEDKSQEDLKAYWSEWLGVERVPAEFPPDCARSPAPDYCRERASEWLELSEVAELERAASSMGTDLGGYLIAALCALCARYGAPEEVVIGVVRGANRGREANPLPFSVDLEGDPGGAELVGRVHSRLLTWLAHSDFEADELARMAAGRGALYRVMLRTEGDLESLLADAQADSDPGSNGAECDFVVCAALAADGLELRLDYDADLFSAASASKILAAFVRVLRGLCTADVKLSELPILGEEERRQVLDEWNVTETEFARERCIHSMIEDQVERTPDATALVSCGQSLTYRELNERANQLAQLLIGRGVGPDKMVGLWLERGPELVIAVLAVLKAGGAYVPMDPHYPIGRVAQMARDSHAPLILCTGEDPGPLAAPDVTLLRMQDLAAELREQPHSNPETPVEARHLAYVIYTSGSTGRPKGVMVEHRNVANFFVGMDQRLQAERGVWLAVTSLSFDISVLELLYTLARGFEVVLFSTDQQRAAPDGLSKSMDFDLFYFGSDEGHNAAPGSERYRLLVEGAKFGDAHGFEAVWTPERHFDSFGGLYPSPAVMNGALAMITKRIQIRAGSVVLPLHDAVRVAEELQLVDNLSDGRTGLAVTPGWQPDDFVLGADSYAERHAVTYEGIGLIQSLWRGESITRCNGVGREFSFKSLPRPVQAELPIWLTCGGGLAGFVKAGELGCNVLTHLLGQTVEQLETKLAAYRAARAKAGHEGPGYVSLMLHTHVLEDAEAVLSAVHEPLRNYLKGSQKLFSGFASELGIDMNHLTDEDRETLAEHSFRRYYESSGLFGTPQSCQPFVARLSSIGVDSIACLIDFGIAADEVLESLKHLAQLRDACQASFTTVARGGMGSGQAEYSIQGLIRTHKVTHLQCTPSMCSMLLSDPEAREALKSVRHWMIGGEVFPRRLATELGKLNAHSTITNMYGPTETTIWSTTHSVDRAQQGEIPIGRPIANTKLYVLDRRRQPVSRGVLGDLYIGGEGVVRGYHERDDLNARHFLPDPFSSFEGARMYWTGDQARLRPDGVVEFLGRADNQVKFRGFRIELGEIETALSGAPQVAEAVVLVREDTPGDKRLVAYLVPAQGETIDLAALSKRLHHSLTEFMIPTAFVCLEALPLTPNAKLDRRALPIPGRDNELARGPLIKPANQLEEMIAGLWCTVLNMKQVGTSDSFFDLGGHSVLVVQVLNALRAKGHELAMTDLFQYPTVSALAKFMSPGGNAERGAGVGTDRAALRKRARMGRQRKDS